MAILATLKTVLDTALNYVTIGLGIARSATKAKVQMVISFTLQATFIILFALRGNMNAVYVVVVTAALVAMKLWWRDQLKLAMPVAVGLFLVIGICTSKDFYDWILVLGNLCHVLHVFFNAKDEKDPKKAADRTKVSQYFLLAFNIGWVIFDAKRGLMGPMVSAIISTSTTAMSLWLPKQLDVAILFIRRVFITTWTAIRSAFIRKEK